MGPNETRNLWLSIGAALFAVFLVYSYSQEKKAEYDKKYGSIKTVFIAKDDIPEMSTIYDNMYEMKTYPNEFVIPDAITSADELNGTVTSVPIKKGQPFTKNLLLTLGPDTGIALQVAPTLRAITIPTDEVRGVAKLIRPGDRVDIIAAIDVGKGQAQHREVSVLLQDVPVLATGLSIANNIPRTMELDASGKNIQQNSLTGDSKYSTITVEVQPKEAQDLIYVLSTSPGNIYFVLRNPNDRKKLERMPSSTAETIMGKPIFDFTPTQTPINSGYGPVNPLQRPVGSGSPRN